MSSFKVLHSSQAPLPIGPYSQAVVVEPFVFLSGQIGVDPKTGELVKGGAEQQIKQIFKNIQAILESAGLKFSNITKLTIYLKDISHFSLLNQTMEQLFVLPYPVRTTVEVSALPKNADVEIESVACFF